MAKNSNNTVPKQLLQKRFLFQSVVFVSLFSMLFMALYQPSFAYSTTWFGFHSLKQTLVTALFYLVSISTLIISKLLLLRFSREHIVTVRHCIRILSVHGIFQTWVRPGTATTSENPHVRSLDIGNTLLHHLAVRPV